MSIARPRIAHRRHVRDPAPVIDKMARVRHVTACRVCRSANLWTFFTLGDQPLANDLVPPDELARTDYRAPLSVMRCDDCHHVQLTHTVPAPILFSNYRFVSGTSDGWHDHCQSLAVQLTTRRGVGFVVDIGSNDGTLLAKFKRLGWRVLGVDPARNLARAAPIPTECAEWNAQTANSMTMDYGYADVITAQNVFGHVDDPVDFLLGIKRMLKKSGEAIIEVPDLRRLLESCAFDTIYHEHLSYWSLVSLVKVATIAGLSVTNAHALSGLHGGSIRITLKHKGGGSAKLGSRLVLDYRILSSRQPFEEFQAKVSERLQAIGALFDAAESPFWGYAAPAKATVLLNALAAQGTRLPDWILDDTVKKQGLFVPGVRVPIAKPEALDSCKTLAVLAWNWADGIRLRAKNRGFRSKYIIPLPKPMVLDA